VTARPPILLTGVAGFIGSQVARHLLARGERVVGIDSLSDYGGRAIKEDRLASLDHLAAKGALTFHQVDIADGAAVTAAAAGLAGCTIIHLAAQAGVRHSLSHPESYVQSNLVGFGHILELARTLGAAHLVFASSSSVYGANTSMPYATTDAVGHPVSLYAATKRANELMAHSYAHLYGLPCTGLRFFTVYGPWGRTDMAPHLFTRAILAGDPIQVFNRGRSRRDFTYIDDIVSGVVAVADRPAAPDPRWNPDAPHPGRSHAPYRLYNIGNNSPVELMTFIATLEELLGRKATMELLPPQPGDVPATCAEIAELESEFGFRPATPLREGLRRYVEWYRGYFGPRG